MYGPVTVGRQVRSWVRDSREQLLARVVPVDVDGTGELDAGARRLAELGDEVATDAGIHERVEELFADGERPDRDGVPTREDRRRYVGTVRRLAAQANVPCPTMGVHPSTAPLCYTVHHDGHAFLVVSRGLLGTLPVEEFEAVLAHELAHLANGDHRFMTWATVPLVTVERFGRLEGDDATTEDHDEEWWGLDRRSTAVVGLFAAGHVVVLFAILALAGKAADALAVLFALAVLVVLGLVVAAAYVVVIGTATGIALGVAYVARRTALAWAGLGTGLFSRGRELAADRAAARLTGNPGALAAALRRLDGSLADPPPEGLRDLAHTCDALNVVPALDPGRDGNGGLLATHPSTATRLERLETLEREYETA